MGPYKSHQLLMIVICAFSSAINCVISTTLPLARNSFSVESKLHLFSGKGGEERIAEVSEAYSVDQKRAKLSFVIPSILNFDHSYKNFWYEAGQSIMFELGSGHCSISDNPEAITEVLKYDLFNFNILQVPYYVVGPARLLFFIDEHKNELKLSELSKLVLVRNIHCLMYKFTYTDKRSKKLDITVYYSGSSLEYGQEQFPIRVDIESDAESVFIEYSTVQVLKMDFFSEALSETTDTELFDRFLITTSCVYTMKPVPLFTRQDLISRLYFEAELKSKTQMDVKRDTVEERLQMTGVYDSKLGLLRIGQDRTAESQTTLYKTLDFKRGLSYITEEKGAPGDTVVTDCVVYKTEINSDASIGQILFGGDDFVYLGKAKYRGLNTNVYKSRSAKLPLWVENSVEYTTLGGEKKIHSTNQKPDGSESIVNIIVHMTDQETPVPILMTINHDGYVQRFNFYNFFRDIHYPGRELFSLANMCASQSKKARVEMVLEADDKRISELTLPNSNLETSLMSILQDVYSLPVVMVHSLELKKINSILFVSFMVAEHQKQVSDLVFIGYGKSENHRLDYKLVYKKLATFNMCAHIATKTANEVTFGWSQDLNTCIVEEGYNTEFSKIRSFSMSMILEPTDYEVYSIKQQIEIQRIRSSLAWLDESSRIRRKLMKDKLNLYTDPTYTSSLYLSVKQFITIPINMLDTYQNESALVGFGLIEDDQQSWQINPKETKKRLETKTQTMAGAMSLYQCRARCLEDSQCRSYSVCQRSMELVCINSRRNFTNQILIQQLVDGNQRGAFKVDIDSEQIRLVRRSHCNIYNKLYMHLYKQRDDLFTVVFPGQLLNAYSREECAQRCFQVNTEVLANDSKIMSRISTIYMSYLPKQDLDEMHQLLAERKNIRRKICNGFFFIPQNRLDVESGIIIDKFLSDPSSPKTEQLEGYCKLEQSRMDSVNTSTLHLRINMKEYSYKFDQLYESFAGIRLKSSLLTKEQQNTYLYYAGNRDKKAPEGSLIPLRDLLDPDYNFQRQIATQDEVSCATLCISGRLGPWPFCQSFDIEVDEYTGTMVCYLNSITLSDAMKSENGDLVDENKVIGKRRLHYEPRDELALLESVEEKEMRIMKQEELSMFSTQFRINPFLSFCIIVLMIVGCGYLGYKAGQVVMKVKNEHSSRIRLMDVDFINQVTAEGSIR